MMTFAQGDDTIIKSRDTKDTSEFMVTITRPEGDESTFKQSYVICGNSSMENIRVRLLIYNELTRTYEDFENTEGKSSWDIGISGIFMKEVILPKEDANKIRIVAYNKNKDLKDCVLSKDLQVNTFTITVIDSGIKDSIKGGYFRITDVLNNLFGSK
jgi:hypothetical protein